MWIMQTRESHENDRIAYRSDPDFAIAYGEQVVRRLRARGLDERADELQGDVGAIRVGGFAGLSVRYGFPVGNDRLPTG
jgi:hypothetical protein